MISQEDPFFSPARFFQFPCVRPHHSIADVPFQPPLRWFGTIAMLHPLIFSPLTLGRPVDPSKQYPKWRPHCFCHGLKWPFRCPLFSPFPSCGATIYSRSLYCLPSCRCHPCSLAYGSPQEFLCSSTTIGSFLRRPVLDQPLHSGVPTREA